MKTYNWVLLYDKVIKRAMMREPDKYWYGKRYYDDDKEKKIIKKKK